MRRRNGPFYLRDDRGKVFQAGQIVSGGILKAVERVIPDNRIERGPTVGNSVDVDHHAARLSYYARAADQRYPHVRDVRVIASRAAPRVAFLGRVRCVLQDPTHAADRRVEGYVRIDAITMKTILIFAIPYFRTHLSRLTRLDERSQAAGAGRDGPPAIVDRIEFHIFPPLPAL